MRTDTLLWISWHPNGFLLALSSLLDFLLSVRQEINASDRKEVWYYFHMLIFHAFYCTCIAVWNQSQIELLFSCV